MLSTSAALSVRPFAAADIPFVVELLGDQRLRSFVHPVAPSHLAAAAERPDLLMRTIEADGQPVGHIVLGGIDAPSRIVELRLIAVAPQGRGYGRFGIAWAQQHAFEELRAHRFWLEVVAHNERARRLCERAGFVQEGMWRDGFWDRRQNRYFPVAIYGMLEDEYRRRSWTPRSRG